MLVTAFYNMADTFFVGMLKSNPATGAVGVVFSLMAIIQAVGFFFGHGSGNFIPGIGQAAHGDRLQHGRHRFFAALATGLVICIWADLPDAPGQLPGLHAHHPAYAGTICG
jgi:Na+-driven multidrug efflux pump